MSYHPIDVANKFIELYSHDKSGVKHVSLQKLIYIAHGSYLACTGKPLVAGGFEAWDYGPVSPDLYKACSGCGRDELSKKIDFFEVVGGGPSALDQNDLANDIISQVYKHFKKYSPSQLISFTHKPGGPWDEVYENGRKSIPIPDKKIMGYFQSHYLK